MKTLILMRHARYVTDQNDPDPALSEDGRRDAQRIAEHLAGGSGHPDLILASSARRAEETASIVAAGFEGANFSVDDRVRTASDQSLLELLRETDERVGWLLVVAHNPTLQRLALWLAGDGDRCAMSALRCDLPAGGTVTLGTDIESWGQLEPGACTLIGFTTPRELAEPSQTHKVPG